MFYIKPLYLSLSTGFYSNNGDVRSGNIFINRHTISKCYDLSTFKAMFGDVEKGDVRIGYGYMNSYTLYQLNGLK